MAGVALLGENRPHLVLEKLRILSGCGRIPGAEEYGLGLVQRPICKQKQAGDERK
jgi:hypothetical protein